MELNLTKEQQLILLGVIASIIIGLGATGYNYFFNKPANTIAIEKPVGTGSIMVQVCGAVEREGVYRLKPGDRLLEAISLAGGAKLTANLSAVNLAELVKDGAKIDVPFRRIVQPVIIQVPESVPTGKQAKGKTETSGQVVNINTASEQALDSLPGVGPSTARAIVEYRKTKGPFKRVEQIMEIPRFGKSKFERIRNQIIK